MNKTKISFLLLIIFLLLSVVYCQAQMKHPVKWSFKAITTNKGETVLTFTAAIEDGWHIYSQFLDEGGPAPTAFTFVPSTEYSLAGKVREKSEHIKKYEEVFMMEVKWFEKVAMFEQKIKLKAASATIKGAVEFMACTIEECLPPETVEFEIPVQAETKSNKVGKSKAETQPPAKPDSSGTVDKAIGKAIDRVTVSRVTQSKTVSLWEIFIAGLFGGFAAFVMPCIFPMVPFTVGLFSKNRSKRSSTLRAGVFGLSIIVIYVSLGLLITAIFGSDALNAISTNGVFNFCLFLLLVIFAASFLGAFEITLPSAWVSAVDSKADQAGGLSIFFAALTLSLVSFSCTGPIIGTLLVEAAASGNYKGPAIGMFGFATALALPFTLFAMFPSWLNKLPKSGGWLNNVKVTLGFLELALALKFLSNIDLAYHWEWFDREVFLALWIIIFGLLGFYLLGKIKLPHDSTLDRLPVQRLLTGMIVLAFTLYMVPGLWGAPLKAISPFLPPQHTQDFDLYTASLMSSNNSASPLREGQSEGLHAPLGLNAYFDYSEALEYAKQVNKPLMIDFTGHACVNCRKMETTVWPDRSILKVIQEEYVLVQLYVDDKTDLPADEQVKSAYSNKTLKTIGNKWSDFQASRFNTNSQPYYVLLDHNEKELIPSIGADYNIESFRQFLQSGLAVFKSNKVKQSAIIT